MVGSTGRHPHHVRMMTTSAGRVVADLGSSVMAAAHKPAPAAALEVVEHQPADTGESDPPTVVPTERAFAAGNPLPRPGVVRTVRSAGKTN
jgi:hypothetical protein